MRCSRRHRGIVAFATDALLLVLVTTVAAGTAAAQWNPAAGQWGRSAPSDLRIMTWNVLDTICSTNTKNSATNNWAAVARVVAAMQPDVLILQECGDNSGNGSGSSADSVANLTTTIGMFFRGGTDTFRGGAITQYVQLHAPGYDLPFVFVSSSTDNFNRNVILSRYPFADLNGDGVSTRSDIPTITADLYSPGGNGGIRGYMTAEIDLPDALYAGDMVVGNSHLKASSGTANHNQRVAAAQNIAYYIDYFWNGAGGTVPDPRNKIADSPAATSVLGPNTWFITGGDLNEDTRGTTTIGPVEWVTSAQNVEGVGAADGPDRNRTDLAGDFAVDLFDGSSATFGGSPWKDDYLLWQDSIVHARRTFLFNTGTVPGAAMPPQLVGFTGGGSSASFVASDHYPVVGDFVLPAPLGCNSAADDLGYAGLGSNGKYPRATVCGSLATGGTALLTIADAAPNAQVYIGWSFSQGLQLALDGTLVPNAPGVFGPFPTDANGSLSIPLAGGLGAFSIYVQWGVVDPGVASGIVFSNALRVLFQP